ncbi:MAG TPA: tyrosine-type recombinase/integrase [Tepidisphaeraceae bacterium]|jgi:integrase|nr:tyrosine-type recombinase/integrase [Tepidisphaeraceae bacterium]
MAARSTPARRRRVGLVSYYEHHGGWWVYHRADGRPVRVHVGTSAALAECEASLLNATLVAEAAGLALASVPALRKLVAQCTTSSALPAGTLSVASAAAMTTSVPALRQAFLAHHEKVLASSLATVGRYRTATLHLENFATAEACNSADAVRADRFVAYLRTLEVSPNGHANTAKRRLRDKGIRYILECCRSMYHFGARQGLLPKHGPNPFTELGVGRLRIRDAKPIFVFTGEQELSFLQSADDWAFAVHFTLAKTGLRPGELAHVLIEEVDFGQGWLSVQSKPELGWTTKTNRQRRIPLVDDVAELLRQRVGQRNSGPLFLRAGFGSVKSHLLSGDRAALAAVARQRLESARSQKGGPLSRAEEARIYQTVWRDAGAVDTDRIRITFLRLARAAGLPAACPKSWRHTFATLLQQANVDPLVRQETLGHKPIAPEMSALGMTGVYTHTTPDFQKAEIERALRLRPQSLNLARHRLAGGGSHGR